MRTNARQHSAWVRDPDSFNSNFKLKFKDYKQKAHGKLILELLWHNLVCVCVIITAVLILKEEKRGYDNTNEA